MNYFDSTLEVFLDSLLFYWEILCMKVIFAFSGPISWW